MDTPQYDLSAELNTQDKLAEILKDMWLVLNKRKILKRLCKMRYYVPSGPYNISQIGNWKAGILETEFLDDLFNKEFSENNRYERFIQSLLNRIEPSYLKTFNGNAKQILEECVPKYIERKQGSNGSRLIDTYEGRKLASIWYWPKRFWNSQLFQESLITLVRWGIPLLAIWILAKMFNINISPK